MSTAAAADRDTAVLAAVERRVLWLATAIVHHANRVRPNPSGLKVGGHQASSASMATIMTELWFRHLRPQDRVSVKPHASPVLHAINHLLGELPREYLTTLREFGGLQSYPSRAKDPDPVDYSTGSVGIGATAPIWGALARRYVGQVRRRGRERPAVLPGRRRRAGRGRLLGGRARPDGRRAGRGRLGRGPQPAEPGPGRPHPRRHPAAGHVRRRRLAGADGQVRAPAAGAVRPPRRRRPARAHRRDVEPRVPAPAALHRRAAARTPARARTRTCARWSTPSTTPPCAPPSATSAATTSTRSARPSPRSTTPGRR